MKFLIQVTLVCLLILITYVIYKTYFSEQKIIQTNQIEESPEKPLIEKDKNFIKNLRYEVNLSREGKYEIKSRLGEVNRKKGVEIILMKDVTALFTNLDNEIIYINSDYAEFNSDNYNTLFRDNIKIKNKDNIITADRLSFEYVQNNILVYGNVQYLGDYGKLKTDNIKINLTKQSIEIFMNNTKDDVIISSNN
tara:strand:+ start:1065 stop:1646 length:582 start_codon:yes stop_codon:yes gene_type:complete